MGYAAMKKIDGLSAMGGEVPHFDPTKLAIVGLDIPETSANWYAHCARLKDITDEDLLPYAESIVAAGKVDHIVKACRDGNRLVPLDGRSTTRAARMAREIQAKKKVPLDERVTVRVNIVKGDEDELYRINLDSHKHRPLTRTQQAKGALVYFNKVGEDLGKTATFFRVDPSTIKLLLAHFDLSEAARKAIDAKELPVTVTKSLAKLPRDKQDEAIKEMKEKGATKGAKAKAAAEAASKGESVAEPSSKPIPKAVRRTVVEHLANGRSNHLQGQDLVIARSIAAYERYLDGDKGALDHLATIKAVVDAAMAPKAKAEKKAES